MAVDFLRKSAFVLRGECFLVKPVLQSLVLADHIYEDKSGKKIICGTFNALLLTRREPPPEITDDAGEIIGRRVSGGVSGSPYTYISLTDVCEGTVLDLQFVSLTKNQVLFEKQITIESGSRLGTVEIVLPLPPLKVPEPGVYAFEIVCEGEIIGSSRIYAKLEGSD